MHYTSSTNSLSIEFLQRMNGTDHKVLDVIVDMCYRTAPKSPTGALYCFPGQRWLGQRLGRTRETISRSVSKLHTLGLIAVTHRRKVHKRWQTNLYQLGHQLLYCLNQGRKAVSALLHRVTEASHIVKKDSISMGQTAKKSDFSFNNKSPGLSDIINRVGKALGYE